MYNIEKAIIEYDRNNEFNNFLKTMIDDCNNNSHYQKIDNEISNTKSNKIKNEKDKDNTIEF